jgi:hypothetical protein
MNWVTIGEPLGKKLTVPHNLPHPILKRQHTPNRKKQTNFALVMNPQKVIGINPLILKTQIKVLHADD